MSRPKHDLLKQYDRRQAIALGYDPATDSAPHVLAVGQGVIAERIIALAKANNIPIQDNPALTAALSKVDIGAEIPPEMYTVVAQVFAYIYRIRQQQILSREEK